MCEVLGVSTSGYYYWAKGLKDNLGTGALDAKIMDVFEKSDSTYGGPRVFKALKKDGGEVSGSTVCRRMRALGATPVVKKRFRATADSNHGLPAAPNILNRGFDAAGTGRGWVSDITYIRLQDSFVYLTTVIDLADRMAVGWNVSDNMTDVDTVIAAFKKALKNRPIGPGLIFHSDRGSQYASHGFRRLLKEHQCVQSMSRKGGCWDNAVAESFFKTIKTESLHRYKFTTMSQVYPTTFNYIDGWYNTMRIHTSLGDMSPREMFLHLNAKKLAA